MQNLIAMKFGIGEFCNSKILLCASPVSDSCNGYRREKCFEQNSGEN
jgi:hypothetical protein